MAHFLKLAASVVCVIWLIAAQAQAGQWTELNRVDFHDCNYRFSGEIQRGDLTGFLDRQGADYGMTRICLDSPGGSLSEVYRFVQAVNAGEDSWIIGTHIESGASCLSSCAILFMFGQTYGANSPAPSRTMEPGARLGFHSPFIAPGRATDADAAEAFQVALQVSKLLVDSAYTSLTMSGAALPPELVAVVLGTPGDDMRYVDAIGELRLLGIDMQPDPEQDVPIPNSEAAVTSLVTRICASSHVFSYPTHYVEKGYLFDDLLRSVERMSRDVTIHQLKLLPKSEYGSEKIVSIATGPYYVPGWYSAGARQFCRVELSVDRKGDGFVVQSYSVGFGFPNKDLEQGDFTWEDIEKDGDPVGLLPVDQAYR